MLNKRELLGVIESHANNIRLVSVLRVLARRGNLGESFRVAVGEDTINNNGLRKSLQLLGDTGKLTHTADQLYFTAVRSAISEAFELTKDYCANSNQTQKMEAQPWFYVFRILRNAINHNFIIKFGKYDPPRLPLEWGTITLEASMENQELSLNMLPVADALDWLECLEEFIINELH
ncbi:hypothetical protein WCX72_00080 [Sulfurimonas sp. HSL1-6]|uniref:hypothetical protein n=1 Tax=Thiomicrolovo immobilis TaxID=3131935 RepID=UPI0031F9CEF5